MAGLLLLRHGQIRANSSGCWHGSTDSPLTWRGRRQAARTARHLAQRRQRIVAIYTSPLERCQRTAGTISQKLGIEPVVVEDLSEYHIGEWEGMRFDDLAERHDFVARATADSNFAPPGGESLAGVAGRIVPAVQDIHALHARAEADEQVLLVGHGAAMAVLLGAILHSAPERWTDFHFANCSLTELVLSPSPYVNVFNSTQHL